MLGKRNHRVRAFSTCHAVVLAVCIVLAHLLALVAPSERLQVSGQDVVFPLHPAHAHSCDQTGESASIPSECSVLLKTTQEKAVRLESLDLGLRL